MFFSSKNTAHLKGYVGFVEIGPHWTVAHGIEISSVAAERFQHDTSDS